VASTSWLSNAGIASSAAIEDTSLAEWERNHRILVTGYFLVVREAFGILHPQDTGGSLVFVASKNALVAGKNAAAYPDAVLSGSKIWGPESSWRKERADAYGIQPQELEEHYRKRNTLKVNIVAQDIAQAVLHFASEQRSGKSTGNLLNVDGGVPAAYAR